MKNTLSLRSFAKTMLSALLLTLFAVLVVFGQENTGSVQGTVKDPGGAVIPGAKITLSGSALVRSLDTTSDKEGNYLFPKVPSGIYTVTISQDGFKTIKSEDVNVVLGQTSRVDVALSAGAVSESVTVTAGSEAIDVSSSKVATNITQTFFDNQPKGRNFHSLISV